MTQIEKTAIQRAEKQLDQERDAKLQQEVYEYLKSELEAVDTLASRIRQCQEQKRIHEENIKNVKEGNLKAIERRREALKQSSIFTFSTTSTASQTPYYIWHNMIAGFTFTSPVSGKTYIF